MTELAFSLDTMPDDLKMEASLKDFKTVDALAKSYVNAVKKIGVRPDLLLKLEQDGSAGQDVWKRLGKPEKHAIPEGLKTPLPDTYKAKLLEFADKHNFTKTQFDELMHFTDGESVAMIEAGKNAKAEARAASLNAVKESLGWIYEQTLNFARNVPEMFEKKGLWDKFEAAGLTTDPDFLGLMGEIGRMAGDDSFVNGTHSNLSPNQAGAEMSSLTMDAEFQKAFLTKEHPGHAAAVDRWKKLTETRFAG